jgi:AcrR family transcriptional regulator
MEESKRVRKRMASEQRREQILLAARTVFVKKGLDGARTRDIAAEAGINEAML